MIQSNELRKGNIVYGERRASQGSKPHFRECIILSVTQLGSDCSYAFADTEQIPQSPDGIDGYIFVHYDIMQPISITKEWLDRVQFKGKFLDLPEGGYIEINNDNAILMPMDGCSGGHTFTCPCKYVHQLQNLYFALTGEELVMR